MKRLLLNSVAGVILVLSAGCTVQGPVSQGGGASEVEVVGRVYLPGNEPAPATQVKLIPQDYDPSVMAAVSDSMIDTTDADGRYSFRNVVPGTYNVQAIQLRQRTRALVTGLAVDSGITSVPEEILQEPGAIRWLFFMSTEHNGYVIVPGTDMAAFVAAGSKDVLLDSVPAGTIPEVRYKVLGDTTSISSQDVDVAAAATTTLAGPLWPYSQRLVLNTSSAGAGISGEVHDFPVLVRLTSDNFTFAQASENGRDLRFASSDGNPLPFEIELWDAQTENAVLWVKMDTVRGNNDTQSITMFWGYPSAEEASNGAKVFDTAAGFAGVWHLAETGNAAAVDATVNRYDGTASHMADAGEVTGAIGNARAFDGDSSYITMPGTAGSRLNFSENDNFTLSAWVYSEAFEKDVYRTIVSKGFRQYFLQVSHTPDPNLWQFSSFRDTTTWTMSHTPATERQWVLLTAVRNGTDQDLYCNGELIVKSFNTNRTFDQKALLGVKLRDTSDDFTVGRFLTAADGPISGNCSFKGMIDEVRTGSVARSADWIKLCYMNQRGDDKLVQFK